MLCRVISSSETLLLIAIVVYHIWKLSQNTNFDYIKNVIEDIKENIDN